MERAKTILNASLLWRALTALCLWCGAQWENSGVVQWFLHPRGWRNHWTTPLFSHWAPHHRHRAVSARQSRLAFRIVFARSMA